MNTPYRDNEFATGPTPSGFVALLWRIFLVLRTDRITREARKETPPTPLLEARPSRVTISMVRAGLCGPFQAVRVRVSQCPGMTAKKLTESERANVYDYWLCTEGNCCCEVS